MERTTTTWTCDRCGYADEQRQGEQPTGWSRVMMVTPPRAEYQRGKYGHQTADLCRSCTREVRADAFARQPMPDKKAPATPVQVVSA